MKVLLIDQIASVTYKYTFSLCNKLNDVGNDVTVVTDMKEDMRECNCNYYKTFVTADKSKSRLYKVMNYIVSWYRIYKLTKKQTFDILHVQWFILSPIDYYFIRKIKNNGIKIIVTVHDILPFNEKKYDYNYHDKIYECADQIILQAKVNIERFKDIFKNKYIEKLNYIPLGNSIDYVESHSMEKAREYLKLPKDKIILLFFGQIKKVKGLAVLIDAFNMICKERNDVILLVAGKTWNDDFSIYMKKIKEYDIEENVICNIKFIPDDEVGYYYSACDLNVLPYLDVYQSAVVQLAYAYSKPVVATNIGSFPEVVIDNVTGLLVEPGNSHELYKAIISVIQDKEKMNLMGIEGNKLIKDEFSWEKIALKIKLLYEK